MEKAILDETLYRFAIEIDINFYCKVWVKTNANVIVTNNLKDFPKEYIAQYGLSVKSADDFLTDTIDLNQELAVTAFRKLVLHRTNPDLDEYEVLEILRNNKLKDAADYLHSLL